MIDLQVLNKVLQSGNIDIIINYSLGIEHFPAYSKEFDYIIKFYHKYGKTPDKESFINKFPEFNFIDVKEPDKFLVDGLKEEYLYSLCVPVVNEFAERLKKDSVDAVEYLKTKLPDLLANTSLVGIDLLKNASKRNEARKRKNEKYFISTGFPELDSLIMGLQKGEELLTLFARTNQGKSWISLKMAISAMEQGLNVIFYSGEMSDEATGYRFDTLFKHFSNMGLIKNNLNNEKEYEDYISKLKEFKNKFIVLTPKLLGGKATVSKLISICEKENAGLLVVDQLSLMKDERAKKGDNTKQRYANISEDLFSFSESSGIPVVLAAQANRKSVEEGENDLPDLEGIAGADDIAQNSSKVLALRQKDDAIEIAVRKNRSGRRGGIVKYSWNIDKGIFEFIGFENAPNQIHQVKKDKKESSQIRRPKSKEDIF